MALLYKGNGVEHINEIPARDLSDSELSEMLANGTAARVCGKDVSLAEFEGMLMKRGLYGFVPKASAKTVKPDEKGEV